MPKKSPSCRLYLIHAREAPRAVVLWRGQADWCHLILWNTDNDELTSGAWFKGRIYETACDLSPDGNLFLCKALESGQPQTSFSLAWTAVCRPPSLKPLALWPHGNTWDGGGFFHDNRTLTIISNEALEPHPGLAPAKLKVTFRDYEHCKNRIEARNAGPCCHDLQGNLLSARDGKIFRRVKWQSEREIQIADFSALKPKP